MPAEVHLHIPPYYRRDFEKRSKTMFFRRLHDEFSSRGGTVKILPSEEKVHRQLDGSDEHFHFVNNGNFKLPNVLNTAIAYIDPFFQVDPRGVMSESSIRDAVYHPRKVPRARSWNFYVRMRKEHAATRQSRYKQLEELTKFDRRHIAVFLQTPSPITNRARRFTSEEMLRSVAKGARDYPILVKAHPLGVKPEEVLAVHDLANEGHDIQMTEANVHDLLENAVCSVSFSSACSFEGFLYRTPAILYGNADFMQFCDVVDDLDGFEDALLKAQSTKRHHARFLYWYLRMQCVWSRERGFFPKILKRMEAMGYDADRLGLKMA